jgi:hypothetical protein
MSNLPLLEATLKWTSIIPLVTQFVIIFDTFLLPQNYNLTYHFSHGLMQLGTTPPPFSMIFSFFFGAFGYTFYGFIRLWVSFYHGQVNMTIANPSD